jgi:two-component system, NtrC family, sensor kinase
VTSLNTLAALGIFPTGFGIFPGSWIGRVVTFLKQRTRTLVLMTLGIAGVIAGENWDARHEAKAAIDDLMREHELLATALLAHLPSDGFPSGAGAGEAWTATLTTALCSAARSLESEGPVIVLFARADPPRALRSCRGDTVRVPVLESAIGRGSRRVTLSRDDAVHLGLPPRIAVAGVARPAAGGSIAVIGSAGSERDRSSRQQARALISIVVVSSMILGFGFFALRQQKRQLALEQQVVLERTRQERDAELAKANRMATLAALASGFAHEIGTPLGIISGRIEQLRSSAADPCRREELLAKAAQQIERIDRLIRGFLGFARGDAPTLVTSSASDVLDSAVRLVHHRFTTAKVELKVHLLASGRTDFACEPALFEQVLVNVLINALEASSPQQVVRARLERSEGYVTFAVTDDGAGIPSSVMERVTEPFFTTKGRRGGSGLGLTIAKEIVLHHRGELTVRRRSESTTESGLTGTEVLIRVPSVKVA